jgi:hypothetical protein
MQRGSAPLHLSRLLVGNPSLQDERSWEKKGDTGNDASPSLLVGVVLKFLVGLNSVVSRLEMYCTNVLMYRTMVLLALPTKVRC